MVFGDKDLEEFIRHHGDDSLEDYFRYFPCNLHLTYEKYFEIKDMIIEKLKR